MKQFSCIDSFRTPIFIKTLILVSIATVFFYFGKKWSNPDGYQQLIFFTSARQSAPSVSLSPNFGKNFDVPFLISQNSSISPPSHEPPSDSTLVDASTVLATPPQSNPPPPPPSPPPMPPPPPPLQIEKFGIVDENGKMSDDFEVGEFDPSFVEEEKNNTSEVEVKGDEQSGGRISVQRYKLCPVSMREYIPCLDNVEAIKKLKSTERGERFERHCPDKDKGLNCLVPPPKGYKPPIPWPRSRDEVSHQLHLRVDTVRLDDLKCIKLAKHMIILFLLYSPG